MNDSATPRTFTISKRFIIAIGLIYSLLILLSSFSVHIVVSKSNAILEKTLEEYSRDILIDKAKTIVDTLEIRKVQSIKDITESIKELCTDDKGFVFSIIYGKTADENYFRVLDTVAIDDPGIAITKDAVVKEQKDNNYLKIGLIHAVADPVLYSSSNQFWKNVYYPFEMRNQHLIVQFMIRTPASFHAMNSFNDFTVTVKTISVAVAIVLVIAVIVLTLLFLHNYSLLLSNLSRFMKEAAKGNLTVSLNTAADTEFQELAHSFNSLIEEIKDMKGTKEKTAESTLSANELFKTGVITLKEQRFDDAIAVFRTLILLNQFVFGSSFNLGIAYAKLRNFSASLSMFEKARDINPDHELTLQYIEKVKRLHTQNG